VSKHFGQLNNTRLCSNMEKVRTEAAWSEEGQRWRLPELIVQKTKLPPAGDACNTWKLAVPGHPMTSNVFETRPVNAINGLTCLI
jgi:hypothetical protein